MYGTSLDKATRQLYWQCACLVGLEFAKQGLLANTLKNKKEYYKLLLRSRNYKPFFLQRRDERGESRVVATAALITNERLPLSEVFPEVHTHPALVGARVGEVTRLARDEFRASPRDFFRLMRLVYKEAVRQELDFLVIAVHPQHTAFYRDVWGFQPLCPGDDIRQHVKLANAPAQCSYADVRHAESRTLDKERVSLQCGVVA